MSSNLFWVFSIKGSRFGYSTKLRADSSENDCSGSSSYGLGTPSEHTFQQKSNEKSK
jgi:hypothetical protein